MFGCLIAELDLASIGFALGGTLLKVNSCKSDVVLVILPQNVHSVMGNNFDDGFVIPV